MKDILAFPSFPSAKPEATESWPEVQEESGEFEGDSQDWEITGDGSSPSYLDTHLNSGPNRWAGKGMLSSYAFFTLFIQILFVRHMPDEGKPTPTSSYLSFL